MKNIFKMTFLLAAGLIHASSFSTELTIVAGVVSRPCSVKSEDLIELAKENALEKLGDVSKFQQVSAWQTWANYYTFPLAPHTCYGAEGNARASFVTTETVNEDWYVTTQGLGHAKDADEFDDEGWRLALENAADHANTYCGAAGAEKTPLSTEKIKKQSIPDVWRIFTVAARFKCVK